MPSANGFDIDSEISDSENKAEEIVIQISEEKFYFKERNCTKNELFRPFTRKSRTLETFLKVIYILDNHIPPKLIQKAFIEKQKKS